MSQEYMDREYAELRYRNRKRRRARQRRRRQRQIFQMSVTLIFCCLLIGSAVGLYRYMAPAGTESAADQQTEDSTDSTNGTSQDGDTQADSQESSDSSQSETGETDETSEDEDSVTVDPDSIIYLTFDDGPSSTSTERILNILKENNIHATFFICNYSEDKIPLLQRMVDEGHTIGIHAYTHEYEACYSTEDGYLDGVEKLKEKLKEDTGYEAFCLRFPGGSSNTISRNYNEGIMTRLVAKVAEMGMEYFDWNVDSEDASGNHIPDSELVDNVTGELVKGRGNVVLMHDTDAKETTVQALQAIIDYGTENGYHFEAIDQNTTPVHHQVNN